MKPRGRRGRSDTARPTNELQKRPRRRGLNPQGARHAPRTSTGGGRREPQAIHGGRPRQREDEISVRTLYRTFRAQRLSRAEAKATPRQLGQKKEKYDALKSLGDSEFTALVMADLTWGASLPPGSDTETRGGVCEDIPRRSGGSTCRLGEGSSGIAAYKVRNDVS